jgi:hypothetical protein
VAFVILGWSEGIFQVNEKMVDEILSKNNHTINHDGKVHLFHCARTPPTLRLLLLSSLCGRIECLEAALKPNSSVIRRDEAHDMHEGLDLN